MVRHLVGAERVDGVSKLLEGESCRRLPGDNVVHRGRWGYVGGRMDGEEQVVFQPC